MNFGFTASQLRFCSAIVCYTLEDRAKNLRVAVMRSTKSSLFRTRRAVERYFAGRTIKCLICGRRFRRLSFHLAAKHGVTTDDYKSRFGLPWTRGLTSAPSHANSGWNDKRKAKASRLARKSRFFALAHQASRREPALFLKVENVRNLGPNAVGFGKQFESRVRILFKQGLTRLRHRPHTQRQQNDRKSPHQAVAQPEAVRTPASKKGIDGSRERQARNGTLYALPLLPQPVAI